MFVIFGDQWQVGGSFVYAVWGPGDMAGRRVGLGMPC